jgi:hypothetical protein
VVFRSALSKDAELLMLRHENQVLRLRPGRSSRSRSRRRRSFSSLAVAASMLVTVECGPEARTFLRSAHYFSWQSTSTLLVTPLVTTTGPEARQIAVPPSYRGLCPETVYLPTGTGIENRPFAPTVNPYLVPLDSWRVTCPLRARGPTPGGPPTAWSVPVRVPVAPGGTVGDEQLASDTEAAMTRSRQSKFRGFRHTAYPFSSRTTVDQPDGRRDEQH